MASWGVWLTRRTWRLSALVIAIAWIARSVNAQASRPQVAVDSGGAIAAIAHLFNALDASDSTALRAMAFPGARVIGPDDLGVLRAHSLLAAIPAAVRYTAPPVTRTRDQQLRIDGDVAQVWMQYTVGRGTRAESCGIAIVDLWDVANVWKIVALTRTRRSTGCGLPRLAPPPAPRPSRRAPSRDTAGIHERARRAEIAFFLQWQRAWIVTEIERDSFLVRPQPRPISLPLPDIRTQAAHCHFSDFERPAEIARSAASRFSACPIWYAGTDPLPADERVDRDGVLAASLRSDIADARNAVLSLLDSAALRDSSDAFVAGQRVRLSLDARDFGGALRAARECRSVAWWCTALAGFSLHQSGEAQAADSVFALATSALGPTERCAWIDARELLEPDARAAYGAVSCTERMDITHRLWWLSDPFLSAPWNERRAEHFARKVLRLLHGALVRNERHMLSTQLGGDAIVEVLSRYGWPSQYGWAGRSEDENHTIWLGVPQTGGAPVERRPLDPYTSFEYSRDRVHTVPAWRAVRNPFTAAADDWTLTAPVELGDAWWPFEHFAPHKLLVQLPDYQSAILRRDTSVLLAVAADLPPATLARGNGEAIVGARLVTSVDPENTTLVVTGNGVVGAPLVLSGLVPSRPMLVGVEITGSGAAAHDARTRFGIASTPGTLANMQAGAIAISEPVLLRVRSDGTQLSNHPDSALALMAGSTRFSRTTQVGVYWETYGISPGDSVDVAVWVERFSRQGAFRRLGIALDIARDLNTPVVATWAEARAGRASATIAGRIPVLGRAIRLDMSTLPAGDYWLDVEVKKPGNDPVRGRRTFVIQ